jgi:hypothetical protein
MCHFACGGVGFKLQYNTHGITTWNTIKSNTTNNMWVAGGTVTSSLAYSYDGINWTTIGYSIMTTVYSISTNG